VLSLKVRRNGLQCELDMPHTNRTRRPTELSSQSEVCPLQPNCHRSLCANLGRLSVLYPCTYACATLPATGWQAMVMIRGQSRTTSATAIFNTPCATPSCLRRGSRISGAIRSCLGKTNAADAGTPIEAETASADLATNYLNICSLLNQPLAYPQTNPQMRIHLQLNYPRTPSHDEISGTAFAHAKALLRASAGL
jgi:hypothetical protein